MFTRDYRGYWTLNYENAVANIKEQRIRWGDKKIYNRPNKKAEPVILKPKLTAFKPVVQCPRLVSRFEQIYFKTESKVGEIFKTQGSPAVLT
jgi:hypothetical protein